MRNRVAAVVVSALALLASGCAHSSDTPTVAPPIVPSTAPTAAPFDPSLPPAEAAMAVVPTGSTTLRVTDWSQVRLDLGFDRLTSASPAGELARFQQAVARQSPVLTDDVLGADAELRQRFGWDYTDVDWAAQFTGGPSAGWALRLDDRVPESAVQAAVRAKVGGLSTAVYYPSTHVLLSGGTTDVTQSWYADSSLTGLIDGTAESTLVHRGCLPVTLAFGQGSGSLGTTVPMSSLEGLATLDAFSVSLGSELAAVHLGALRDDAFDRARVADRVGDRQFTNVFTRPLADPGGGRLGYTIDDPTAAARLTLAGELPFATCSGV